MDNPDNCQHDFGIRPGLSSLGLGTANDVTLLATNGTWPFAIQVVRVSTTGFLRNSLFNKRQMLFRTAASLTSYLRVSKLLTQAVIRPYHAAPGRKGTSFTQLRGEHGGASSF